MRTTSRVKAVLSVAAAAVIGLGLAVTTPVAQAQDESSISFGDNMTNSGVHLLAGGEYAWRLDIWQPAPALIYGVPAAVSDQVGAQPLSVTFHWGDGTTTTVRSDADPATASGWMGCDNYYETDDSTDPPTYTPGDNFGYNCSAEAGHSYGQQGVYSIWLTGEQPTGEGTATGESSAFEYLIVNVAAGGTLTGKGSVTAPAGGGGMYDTDFAGGTVTFQVTAKRKSATLATTASVVVSAPTMTPDYPLDAPRARGMTFTGSAAQDPLYMAKTKGGGEVILTRVEGVVTNSRGSAGGAWATIHTIVQKGQPTLIRIQVQNTSAGYTYLDTGYQPTSYYGLSAQDLLQSGSVKVG